MKRLLYFFPLFALLAVLLFEGCQKEPTPTPTPTSQDLSIDISSSANIYLGQSQLLWNEGDKVHVNNSDYPLSSVSDSSAVLQGVAYSPSYRAVYPANLVYSGWDISTMRQVPISLPLSQKYVVEDGHQKLSLPMGAYSKNNQLLFRPLCGIIRVTLTNHYCSQLPINMITLTAANAHLSGFGTAVIKGMDSDSIFMSPTSYNTVSLGTETSLMLMLDSAATTTFDIFVPAFSDEQLTVTVNTSYGSYIWKEENVSVTVNSVVNFAADIAQMPKPFAQLVPGRDFNNLIRQMFPDNGPHYLAFEFNSLVSTGTIFSSPESTVPIYGVKKKYKLTLYTSADSMYANPDCSYMFQNFNVHTPQDQYDGHHPDCELIFPSRFNTSQVRDMSYMFYQCAHMCILDIGHFNTDNVTDMSYMFYMTRQLFNLNLHDATIGENTPKTNMFYEFARFANSDTCFITCSLATKAALEEGTGLDTNIRHFYWNTH